MSGEAYWSFRVIHVGRGGRVECSAGEARYAFEIDHVEGGAFEVHIQGCPATVRGALARQLRDWLDRSDRSSWSITGA